MRRPHGGGSDVGIAALLRFHYASAARFAAGIRRKGASSPAMKGQDGWWFDGVEPGSMSEGGETLHQAYEVFRALFPGRDFSISAAQAEDYAEFTDGATILRVRGCRR